MPGTNASASTGLRRENPLEPHLLARYRAATPEGKLAAVARLNSVLLGLKAAQLAAARPAGTAAQQQAELRRWWFSAHD